MRRETGLRARSASNKWIESRTHSFCVPDLLMCANMSGLERTHFGSADNSLLFRSSRQTAANASYVRFLFCFLFSCTPLYKGLIIIMFNSSSFVATATCCPFRIWVYIQLKWTISTYIPSKLPTVTNGKISSTAESFRTRSHEWTFPERSTSAPPMGSLSA